MKEKEKRKNKMKEIKGGDKKEIKKKGMKDGKRWEQWKRKENKKGK